MQHQGLCYILAIVQATVSYIHRLRNYWFTPVNNSPLIVFRILFGCVMLMEYINKIFDGWVKQVYMQAPMRFPFMGFEFLHVMQGQGMYAYFWAGVLFSTLVILGLFYRPASILLALTWSGVYFSQKEHYNNHFYLMMLLCWVMTIVPANRRASLDVKLKLVSPSNECYRWSLQIFIIQTAILYTYASIAKLYPDWLNAVPVKIWFAKKTKFQYIGPLFGKEWFAYVVAYSGIIFDLLIVPALLWRRTRILAIVAMLIFHQFNKITFGIGVFPYMAMSLNVFFFPGKTFDNTVGIESKAGQLQPQVTGKLWLTLILATYVIWQVLTPLRHHLYKGDVTWTEEGHRMSWRMMLRTKKGTVTYTIKDKHSDSVWYVNPEDHLLKYQSRNVPTRPDFTWQYAQYLHDKYKTRGYDVAVYAKCMCSLNGRPMRPLIDSTVDLAQARWKPFAHNDWVLTEYK